MKTYIIIMIGAILVGCGTTGDITSPVAADGSEKDLPHVCSYKISKDFSVEDAEAIKKAFSTINDIIDYDYYSFDGMVQNSTDELNVVIVDTNNAQPHQGQASVRNVCSWVVSFREDYIGESHSLFNKLTVHEVGHVVGLGHVDNPDCVMNPVVDFIDVDDSCGFVDGVKNAFTFLNAP